MIQVTMRGGRQEGNGHILPIHSTCHGKPEKQCHMHAAAVIPAVVAQDTQECG